MRIFTVVGARPQFIKAAPLSAAIRRQGHQEIFVHTGQHYDVQMSDVFFKELDLPTPDHHLGIGSGGHGAQTGSMLASLEPLMQRENPDVVLVYGDTNSTLAGALAAAKLHIPVAHVEAGLRSFNRRMPEEINRVMTDHISNWLFAPTANAVSLLASEGITGGVHNVGDIMLEATRNAVAIAERHSTILTTLHLDAKSYSVLTLHRAENTDDPMRLRTILDALAQLPGTIVFPIHPRTRKALVDHALALPPNVTQIDPLGYGDMLWLTKHARTTFTDSGGLQKESFFLGTPCVTLRDETEWVETQTNGWNQIVGTDSAAIVRAAMAPAPAPASGEPFGAGDTAERIVSILSQP